MDPPRSLFRLDSEGPILEYRELSSYGDRSLRRWADFCSSCFAEKGVPSKTFLDNYHNDPNRDFCKIYIAIERRTNVLGGAVRIIRRSVWCGTKYIDVVGIADVCTEPLCRHQGVGTRLMQFAIRSCKDAGETTFLLHCNEKLHSFYARVGFHMLRSQWSLVSAHLKPEDFSGILTKSRSEMALIDANAEQIAAFAKKFVLMSENSNSDLSMQGTMKKSAEYFRHCVSSSKLLGLPYRGRFRCICDKRYVRDVDEDDTTTVLRSAIGYAIIGKSTHNSNNDMIYDIGILSSHAERFAGYIQYLFADMCCEMGSKTKRIGDLNVMKFEVPSSLGIYLASSGLFESHIAEVDNGWMVHTEDMDIRYNFDCEFSFWPIDHF